MPDLFLVTLVHALSTWAMVGLIWFVQVVHYPLMGGVGGAEWTAYERAHTRRTTWVVLPWMVAEMVTALLLAANAWGLLAWPGKGDAVPAAVPATVGAVLVVAVWLSTFLLQVPCHARLERAWDPTVHRRLVATNWVRTILWSARGVVAAALLMPR